jgi:hypothetical protein
MQPYLFPYIGYFALGAAVDRFVFYDDVGFIRNGWINRNRWLVDGRTRYFTVPVRDASSFRAIRDVRVDERQPWRRKLLATLHQHYRHAPHYQPVAPLVESVLTSTEDRIAELAKESVKLCLRYLGLNPQFIDSSTIYGNQGLRGVERVLDICHREAATEYVNLPSGRALYDDALFARQGVALRFIGDRSFIYTSAGTDIVPDLSIIDVLMHNEKDVVLRALVG